MIVDLVRNDLGRIARTGTVNVPELLAVRPAPAFGTWCRLSRPKCPTTCRFRHCWTPPSRRLPSREPRNPAHDNCFRSGNNNVAASTAEPWASRPHCRMRAQRGNPHRGIRRRRNGGPRGGRGITADSDPYAEWQECHTRLRPSPVRMCGRAPPRHRARAVTAPRDARRQSGHTRPDPHAVGDQCVDLGHQSGHVRLRVAPARTTVIRPGPRRPPIPTIRRGSPPDLLVDLRQFATHRRHDGPPQYLDGVGQTLGQPSRRLEETQVRNSVAKVASHVRRADRRRGRILRSRTDPTPAPTPPAQWLPLTAGRQLTGSPAATHALTIRYPGR